MNCARLSLIAALSAAAPVSSQQPPALPKELTGLNNAAPAAAEPDALKSLRLHYAESISVADRSAHAQWVTSLSSLEKSRAASGDYAGAERVRARKESAIAIAGTADGRLPVKLIPQELTSKGSGLSVNDKTITITSKGAFLEWERAAEFKGWYEVRLTHGVAGSGDDSAEITPITGPLPADRRSQRAGSDNSLPSSGGWVSFQNVSGLSRNDIVLRRELVSTGGWNAWTTVSLGKLEITGGRARFRLFADEGYGEGLMHFREIELIPVTPPVTTGPDGETRLTRARETFSKTFRQQTAAATARYRESLNLLEQESLRNRDTDMVVRVKDEKNRLAAAPDKLALDSDSGSGSGSRSIKLEVTNSFGCQFRGESRLDSKTGRLINLRPAGSASVTWRLQSFNVGSGVYKVTLKGRVPVNGGGEATLSPFAAASAPAGKPMKIQVKPAASREARSRKPDPDTPPLESKSLDLEAGSLTISKGAESLTLSVDSLVHGDGVFADLAGIILTRTGDVPPSKPAP